jgi:hypothetical protein
VNPPNQNGPRQDGPNRDGSHQDGSNRDGERIAAWYAIDGPRYGQTHLSHLCHALGWAHGWEALAEAIEAIHKVAQAEEVSVCFGGRGPYDLMVHPATWPGRILFAVIPNIDFRGHVAEVGSLAAAGLLPLVGNNGCGPDRAEDLVQEFADTLERTRRLGRPIAIGGHAGLYDPVIRPDGAWCLIDGLRPSYSFTRSAEPPPELFTGA